MNRNRRKPGNRSQNQVRMMLEQPLRMGQSYKSRNLGEKVRIVGRDFLDQYLIETQDGQKRMITGLTVYADGSIEWESSEAV